jgi:PAS domain S-box-containing protein
VRTPLAAILEATDRASDLAVRMRELAVPMSTPTRTAPGNARALAGFTQAILDTASEAIVSLDRHGVVRSFNRAAERMFGWPAADIVGGRADRLMPRPEDTRRDDHLSPYLVVGGPMLGRVRKVVGLRRDGTRFPLDLSVSQFDGEDGPQFTWVLRDMSEQTRLQEQLRQAQKMDAMGRMAGGVAHDFNNLLTVINGWCEALSSASADERKAAIDQITSAAAKAAPDDAAALVRPQESALNPCVLDLNPVIEDIGRMLRRVIGGNIRLEAALLETPAFVRIDQGRLGQVLVNLALNARDAMRAAAACVSRPRARSSARATKESVPPGNYVTLTVSDTRHRHSGRRDAAPVRTVLHHQVGSRHRAACHGARHRAPGAAHHCRHQPRRGGRPVHHPPAGSPDGSGVGAGQRSQARWARCRDGARRRGRSAGAADH